MDWQEFLFENLKIRPVEKYEIHYTDDCKELLKILEKKYKFPNVKKVKVSKSLLKESIIIIKEKLEEILTEAREDEFKLPPL